MVERVLERDGRSIGPRDQINGSPDAEVLDRGGQRAALHLHRIPCWQRSLLEAELHGEGLDAMDLSRGRESLLVRYPTRISREAAAHEDQRRPFALRVEWHLQHRFGSPFCRNRGVSAALSCHNREERAQRDLHDRLLSHLLIRRSARFGYRAKAPSCRLTTNGRDVD